MSNVFCDERFIQALIKSGSIGHNTGWMPQFFSDNNHSSTLYNFIKTHSYGEYIFDWQWANAFAQYDEAYYPKLTSMIPFTPVTTPHFIHAGSTEIKNELMDRYEEFYLNGSYSSSHFLFITHDEVPFFKQRQYVIRESFQYHFFNQSYQTFENFLESLKGKKAKQIKKERVFSGLTFRKITGEELKLEHAQEVYDFYLSTIKAKQGIPYLKKEFFRIVFQTMKENILYVQASQSGRSIAGAFYFYDQHRLYGRYWGTQLDIPNLHFELCYYQGIEFAIEKKLDVFEAGAQGEHKIARGFRPVRTFSAHKIKHPAFSEAINKFIEDEKIQIEEIITELKKRLPFKSNS